MRCFAGATACAGNDASALYAVIIVIRMDFKSATIRNASSCVSTSPSQSGRNFPYTRSASLNARFGSRPVSIWYTFIFCVIIERNTLSMCAICTTSTRSVP